MWRTWDRENLIGFWFGDFVEVLEWLKSNIHLIVLIGLGDGWHRLTQTITRPDGSWYPVLRGFGSTLNSFNRHDPLLIVVGEITLGCHFKNFFFTTRGSSIADPEIREQRAFIQHAEIHGRGSSTVRRINRRNIARTDCRTGDQARTATPWRIPVVVFVIVLANSVVVSHVAVASHRRQMLLQLSDPE